jgi:hypothetical protein
MNIKPHFMKKTKTLFLFIAAIIVSISTAFSQGGTTGPLTWNLNDNILTITGIGAMPNYNSPSNVPWYPYMNSITTLELGSGVTHIGNNAFYGCYNLNSPNLSNITSIGDYAFRDCGSISFLTISSNVTSIGTNAFRNCTNLATVNFNATNCTYMGGGTTISHFVFQDCGNLTTLTIGNNVTRIPSYTFANCSNVNSSILMPNVTNIGEYAFYGCSSIPSIIIPSGVTSIKNYTFYFCSSISSIDISNVTSIGDYAFRNCSSLSSITIPSGVTSIGYTAFMNCSSLSTVNFNATNCTSMVCINTYCVFQECNSLTTLNIGSNVTQTPENAFRNCSSLADIYTYRAMPPTAYNNSTFFGINKNTCVLHVPTNTQGAYSVADGWKEFFNIVGDVVIPTYTVSGQVTYNSNPLSGVTMAFTGGSTTTNSLGQYSIMIDEGTTITITPSLSGYTFTPPNITCTNVTGNLTNQNFTAFIPVTNIIGVPTTATATAPLTLTGTVVPGNATNQTITWSVQSAGTTGANIIGGSTLNTTSNGTCVVLATIVNGTSPTQNYMQQCTIAVSKATLTGTPTITGNAVFGQTLTAITTGLSSTPTIPNLGTLSYQWRRGTTNISGATNSTYVLQQADIDQTINVQVTAANCTGTVTSASTETVTKAPNTTVPPAPTMASKNATSITLNTVSGCEYNKESGTFQTSPLFNNLTPNTPYIFTQRYAETNTHLPSPASAPATFTTDKATLGGTVTINGSPVFEQTLTAITTGLNSTPTIPNLGTLSYQWRRGTTNISGATNSTYVLQQADIDQTINVQVTAANCTGTVTSASTATITKAPNTNVPPAPTMASNTSTIIILNTVSGCEYKKDGAAYQPSPQFGGLSPNTSYSFTQRYAETNTHLPSSASTPATFSTEEGTPPILGGTVTISGNAVFGQTLTAVPNLTSTPPSDLGEIAYQWKRSGTPTGTNATTYILTEADITHTITVTVTAANCTGNVSSNPTAVVTKATQTTPDAPTLDSATQTSITLNIVLGCEYNINDGAYQELPTFEGLTPNTSYTFTQRKAETATHFASPASAPANFKTDETEVPLYTIVSSVNNQAWGTITPYGENLVEEGGSIEFTITAFTGYKVESVMINGVNYGAIFTHTFENVHEHGTIAVVFVNDMGISESALQGIVVYPNPTRWELRITNCELRIESVEVFDIYGRALLSHLSFMSPETMIDISHLPAGVYFLRMNTEAGQVIRKVLKE